MILWLSIAVIQHQYDASPSQHTHHNCQLFSHASHGAHSSTPTVFTNTLPDEHLDNRIYRYSKSVSIEYCARSPPVLIYT
ncbi:DUF2607 family protein [Vibrio sinensis]|uniref:DUF2607 family protein n=2 Tax=Vibrio sinensis TaxID=2302434 RepID=A0A3A6QAY8_9VIBR|nr:DUF2607 family protein [Vibrio sinensis]